MYGTESSKLRTFESTERNEPDPSEASERVAVSRGVVLRM